MARFVESVEGHAAGIFAHGTTGITNTFLEEPTSVFSADKRRSRGLRSPAYRKTILYFVAGKLKLPTLLLPTENVEEPEDPAAAADLDKAVAAFHGDRAPASMTVTRRASVRSSGRLGGASWGPTCRHDRSGVRFGVRRGDFGPFEVLGLEENPVFTGVLRLGGEGRNRPPDGQLSGSKCPVFLGKQGKPP